MARSSARRRYRIVPPKRPGLALRLLRGVLFLGLVGFSAFLVIGMAVYFAYAPTVPVYQSLDDYQPKLGSRLYSADNQLIGEFAAERRVLVRNDQVPPLLFKAFMAAEDKRFYEHSGIDIVGILKAVVDKIRKPGEKLRGASTITQQVAKSLLVTHESYEEATARKFGRKIREAILALRLERALTKDEILYLYVNQIFLGHKAYGVQAAAEHYFKKNVWELTLAEMATLAGLPQRPSDYSPVSRPEAARARCKYVLRRMLEDGHITKEQYNQAIAEEIKVYPREELYLQIAPYYTEQVRREIIDKYGEVSLLEEGLEIYTAVNLQMQTLAADSISRGLHALDKRQGYRGPLTKLKTDKLKALFKQKYRQSLGLKDGQEIAFKPDDLYLAVVTGFEEKGKHAILDIAGREGLLPLAGMRWARPPDPTERVDSHYLTDVRRALKTGDVITVMLTSRAELGKDTHGWEAFDSIPKEGEIVKLEQEPIANGALLSVDPESGYVLAQEGGYDFDESTYNRAVQACREPGSAFKPIVYTAAIDKLDYTPSTLIDDKPMVFDDPDNAVRWKPENAAVAFRGQLPLRTCVKDSINVPAIRVAEAVGIEDLLKNARRLGLTTPLKRELGIAIGSSCTTLWDLVNVYTTVNQYGERRDLHFIRRVVDRFGNVLEDHTASWDPTLDWASRLDRAYARLVTPKRQVLDRQTAYIMINLLRDVVEDGTGVGASHLGHIVAGKTGTTNDSFDAWFMGFTRHVVTGVWVGHDKKERPLGVNEQGGRTALPVWVDFMGRALKDYTVNPPRKKEQGGFEPPPGVVRVAIDPDTGLLARPGSPRVVYEFYRMGTEPSDTTPDKTQFNPDDKKPWEVDDQLGGPM